MYMSSGISSNADKKVKVNAFATPRSLNFSGSGVTISENTETNAFDITITGGSGGGGGPHATTHHSGGTDPLTLSSIAGSIGDAKITDLVYSKLTSVPATFTPSAHNHSGADINSGTVPLTQIPTIDDSKISGLAYSKLTGVPADPTTATNVGSGTGTIFRDKTTDILNLKTLVAGSNVAITNGADTITIDAAGGGGGTGGAPTGASYITLGIDATLTAERVLTAGTNISLVDAGIGSTLTINVPDASETTKGVVKLATSVETVAGLAIQASDTRLSNSRTPTAHATSHHSSGTDALTLGSIAGTIGNAKIDDLAYSKLTSVPATFAPSAHKSSHVSGGGDVFVKTDVLVAQSRYIEETADPVSDSRRIWINSGGADIEYWDNAITPVQRTLAITTDPRFTDARAPTAHVATHHSGGTDALTLGSIAGSIGDAKITDLAYSKLTSVPASFTPSVHATTHLSGGTDPIAAATESARGIVQLSTSAQTTAGLAVQASDTRLSDTRAPTAHAATHLSNGTDPIAVATTAVRGTVLLAADGGTTTSTAVQATDTRLSNARTPTAHASTHNAAGTDVVHLDTIGAGTNITTNNATTTQHGLAPRGSGVATEFLNGNLAWATPSGGGAHATSHAAGGTDPFTKTTILAAPSRYIEQAADPASDSGRIWINSGSEVFKYWDTSVTPVQRTIANLLSVQTFQNKTIDVALNPPINSVVSPQVKKIGLISPDATANQQFGMLVRAVAAGTGTFTNDTTHGRVISYDTGGTTNSRAGFLDTSTATPLGNFMLAGNFTLKVKFKIPLSGAQRIYIGLSSTNALPTTDTILATTESGIIFGIRTTDTNYQIFHNSGGGAAMTVTPYGGAVGPANTWNILTITANATTPSVSFQLDGGTTTTITTALPAVGTGMLFRACTQNSTTTPKKFDHAWSWAESFI